MIMAMKLNGLRSEQNVSHVADDFYKYFVNEDHCILMQILFIIDDEIHVRWPKSRIMYRG